MKSFFITLFLVTSCLPALAQVDKNNKEKIVENSLQNKTIEFTGDWQFTNQGDRYYIVGETITNNSEQRTQNLKLSVFLVPTVDYSTFNFLSNEPIKTISLGRIAGNGSSIRNIKIDFKSNFTEKFPNGEYVPVLVLNNSAMDRIVLNNLFIQNGKIDFDLINLPEPTNNVGVNQPITTADYEQKGYQFKPIVSSDKVEKDILFDGKIELEINRKDYKVILKSKDGFLINYAQENNPVKVRVVLVKDLKENEDGKGFNIAEYSLEEVPAETKLGNFTFQTNLLRLVPKGEYTPVLLIAKEENWKYLFKSSYVFNKKIVINN